jgi:hypothetical protein
VGNSGRRSLWIALNVCLAPSDHKKDRGVAIQGAEVAACHRNVSKVVQPYCKTFLVCAMMINGLVVITITQILAEKGGRD